MKKIYDLKFWLALAGGFVCLAIVLGYLFASPAARAEIWSDTVFVGDVSTQAWTCVTNSWAAHTNGGNYTNRVYTNTYRISGTNMAGRIPATTNLVMILPGATNASNAVYLAWQRPGGVHRVVVEKSYDAGSTWTNWLTVAPGTTNWTDDGSNTWSTNIFTNAYTLLTAPSVPWITPAEVDLRNVFTNAPIQLFSSNNEWKASYHDILSANSNAVLGDRVRLSDGIHNVASLWTITNGIHFHGQSRHGTVVRLADGVQVKLSKGTSQNFYLGNMTLQGSNDTALIYGDVNSTDGSLFFDAMTVTNQSLTGASFATGSGSPMRVYLFGNTLLAGPLASAYQRDIYVYNYGDSVFTSSGAYSTTNFMGTTYAFLTQKIADAAAASTNFAAGLVSTSVWSGAQMTNLFDVPWKTQIVNVAGPTNVYTHSGLLLSTDP